MNWSLAGQIATIAVIWLAIAFVASPFVGRWLRKRRQRSRSARCAKLEKLVALADEYDAAETPSERSRIYRKAEALGLCDPPAGEFEGAFMDSDEGPRAA